MPEVARLVCDFPDCGRTGVRYYYYTAPGYVQETICCPKHNPFVKLVSRPAAGAVPRRPRVTDVRKYLREIFVEEDSSQ